MNVGLRQCFLLLAILFAGCGNKTKHYNPKNLETAHIYFGAKTVLEQDDIDALNEFVDIYNTEKKSTNDSLVVVVCAYTSRDGSLKSNKAIAAKRAKIVADYLASKKVPVMIKALDDPRIGDGKKSKAANRYALCTIVSKKTAESMCCGNSKNNAHKASKKPYKAPVAAKPVEQAKPAPVAPAAAKAGA